MNLSGLASLAQSLPLDKMHPVVRVGVRYWWVSVPMALVYWSKIKARQSKGKVEYWHYVEDAAAVAMPVMTLVGVFGMIEKMDRQQQVTNQQQLAAAAQIAKPVVATVTQEEPQ